MPWNSRVDDVFPPRIIPHQDAAMHRWKAIDNFKPVLEPVSPKTYYGIEVEIERVPTTNNVLDDFTPEGHRVIGWRNIEDGSLRNNGREFVSCAVAGEDVEYALSKLKTALMKNPRTKGMEFTERTSVHIHVNAQRMLLDNMRNFLLCYIAVEPVLYRFCGGRRHKNIFCIPLNQARDYIKIIKKFTDAPNREAALAFNGLVRGWKKYLGLNLLPIQTQGTIEFRHMPGNLNVERIHRWINIITKLLMYSCNTSYEYNKELLRNLNTNSMYSDFVRSVFPNEDLTYSNMEAHLEGMVKYVKLILGESSYPAYLKEFRDSDNNPLRAISCALGDMKKLEEKKVKATIAHTTATAAWVNEMDVVIEAAQRLREAGRQQPEVNGANVWGWFEEQELVRPAVQDNAGREIPPPAPQPEARPLNPRPAHVPRGVRI